MSGRLWFWVLVPLLAASLAAQGVRGWRRLEASRLLRQVEIRTVQVARGTHGDAGALRRNLRLLDAAQPLDPSLVGVLVARGSQHLLLGDAERAIAAYEAALALEPRPETYFNLGRAQLLRNDRGAAERALALAVKTNPLLRTRVAQLLAE